MDTILQDIRIAVRSLARTPAFAALAVMTIAFGIGASSAAFSMVEGVLLRRLPYAANDRLVHLNQPSATQPVGGFSQLEIADYRTQVPELATVSEYHSMPFQLYGRGEPQRVQTGVVSDHFFTMLGVKPLLGRLFTPGEEAVGAAPVVVLDYKYWVDKMGADPGVIGATFTMNDHVHTIVGVLPPLPTYPNANDIWMPAGACPFRSAPQTLNNRNARMLQVFATLKPGATLERASRSMTLVADRLHTDHPEAYPPARKLRVEASSLRAEMTQQSRPLLLVLFAMAAFVLVIAAANFASLLLSRQMRRGQEVAVRSALGASRGRLFRQLATESLCVTLSGAVLGIAITFSGLGLMRSLAERVTPRAAEIRINPMVLGFAVVVSIVVGLAAAAVPVVRNRANVIEGLRASTGNSGARSDGRLRGALVLVQVAVACIVLVGAGLMSRSLMKLQAVDGGYDARNVLTAFVGLNWSRYTTPQLVTQFADQFLERLAATPGVTSVALSSDFPLNNPIPSNQPILLRGQSAADAVHAPKSDVTSVTSAYFKTMGIPLERGRVFSDRERDTTNTPLVISHQLATTLYAGKDPIGETISIDNGRHWGTIVGIVGDVRQNNLSAGVTDEVYVPYFARPGSGIRVVLRAKSNPSLLAPVVRKAVYAQDDKQPISAVQTLEELRGVRLTEPRVTTVLLVAFAVLALVITSAGLVGIVAQSVTQRTTEIGIRVALGADAGRILAAVMRQSIGLVVAGIVLGLVAATAITRLISGLLFELAPTDPITYGLVATLLFALASIACFVPATRALAVQPIEALRAR